MKKFVSLILALAMLLSVMAFASAEEAYRPRLLITTDVEVDDMDSLIHILLYANDFDIDGIVYSSSTHHWTGDGEHKMSEVIESFSKNGDLTEWRPMELGWIENLLLNEYAEVYPNLIKHDPRYPTPGELIEVTKVGNILFESDYRFETEGSNFIKDIILDDDPRMLYLQAWGGTNTIARALLSIEEQYKGTEEWDAIYEKIGKKCMIVACGNQDTTYVNYISVNWPNIKKVNNIISGYGYPVPATAPLTVRHMFQSEWMMENIKFGHGALMSKYITKGDGTYLVGEPPENQFGSMEVCFDSWLGGFVGKSMKRYDFISEGDSPCWMYLLPVGLRGAENGNYGSWGGRLNEQGNGISEFDPTTGKKSSGYSVFRWIDAFHNDWAARADWCVNDFDGANHQPVVTAEVLDFEVAPGATVELVGSATDPDGDNLNCNWWVYKDACVYSGANMAYVDVWAHDVAATSFTVPADAADGDYFNIVFEVTDDGAPALTRYAQAIVKVVAPAAE